SLTIRGLPEGRYKQFVLDRYGFRGPEIDSLPAPGCTRVMALGASETFGFTESEGKNYTAQLADSLRPHGCYEVINAGIMGITGPNLIRFWNLWASRFRPSIVIVYPTPKFYLDDPAPSPLSPQPPHILARPPWWHSRLWDHLHDRIVIPPAIQAWRTRRALARATAGRPASWFFTEVPQDRMEAFGRDLDSLVQAIRSAGALPVVVAHATRYGPALTENDKRILLGWRLLTPRATAEATLAFEVRAEATIHDIADRRRVPLADADHAMTGHSDYFVDSQHFTDQGAAVLAGLLAQTIVASRQRP
ncbi:MAG TPA: hypothetical protein VH113_08555, partial [Gemmatimonadales bacterium]|nr:hypothetical protein [Gemmatimonadales bacterium]